ncbi:pseudouridylate synthase 7 homolog [Sabethes cyaneus]|uniref:pseudouridylate synthase 7 homolog n=1 Tax=Sabethes cyaneus TaxID=53552 RepID=UPI00237E0F8C|nr:pseudouridylate synthase 7 homolog [Sabethes cyaneus]
MGRDSFRRGGGHRGSSRGRHEPAWSQKRGGGGGRTWNRNNTKPANRNHKEPRESVALSDLKEEQVFITEYVSAGKGFHGILKSRFSDFHVNEIDLDGNEAILTDLNIPAAPREEMDDKPNAELEEMLSQLITADKLDQIRQVASKKRTSAVEIDVTELTKEDRGKIHNGTKSLFGRAVVGSTVTRDDKKYITITAYSSSNVTDRRKKWLWPHPFTYFLLYKENVDTIQAVGQMSEQLKCSTSSFTYAGTKDRRAKTTQWISIRQFEPSKIASAVKRLQNIKIGNICFKPTTLRLGQLGGNRFRIALRQIVEEESVIKSSMEAFRDKGFINYFGLQRFGNRSSVPTYKIGIEMLKGSWKEACDLILKPREGDPWFITKMRETWEQTRCAETALAKLSPRNKGIEKQILSWLATHSNDYKGAIQQLARNLRMLYCHSYQSLIWNRVVSRRLRELGYRLIPGDLVYVPEVASDITEEIAVDADSAIEQAIESDAKKDVDETPADEQSTEPSRFKAMVKPLTEEDIESGQYSIFDVVLPLPGHDITYPANESGKWYEELMAEDGLSSDMLRRKEKKESLPGAYRKVIVRPEKLEWKLVSYEKPTDTLILSDLEKLKGEKMPEPKDEAPHKALLLDFCFPASAYATMALREIMKIDTSALHQRTVEKERLDAAENKAKPTAEPVENKTPAANSEIHDKVDGVAIDSEPAEPIAEEDANSEEPAEKKPKLD